MDIANRKTSDISSQVVKNSPKPAVKHTNAVVTVKSIVLFSVLTILNISVFVFIAFENQIDLIAKNAELEIRDKGLRLKLKIEQIVTGQESGRLRVRYDVQVNRVYVFSQPQSNASVLATLAKGETVFSEEIVNDWHRITFGNAQKGWVHRDNIGKHVPAWQTGRLSLEDVRLIMGTLDDEGVRQYAIFLENGSVILDSRQPDRRRATGEEQKWIERMIFRNDFEGFAFSQKIDLSSGTIDLYLPIYYASGKLLVIRPTIPMHYIEVQKNFLYRQCIIVGLLVMVVHICFVLLNQWIIIFPMVRERVMIMRLKNKQIKTAHEKLNETYDQLHSAHEQLRIAHESIQKELDVARDLQLSLIPTNPPRIQGYSFMAYYEPAEKVGGDYYDFLQLDPQRIGVLIADASGHGIPAALLVSMAKITFSNPVLDLASPSFMLEQTNIALKKAIHTHHFLTVFYLVLDTYTGALRYARAGHPPVIIYRARTQSIEELSGEGIALGLVDSPAFEQHESVLEPGDRMVLYSDGIIEAFNSHREMYGIKSLRRCVFTNGRNHPGEIINAVLEDVRRHTEDLPLADDATIVVIGRG